METTPAAIEPEQPRRRSGWTIFLIVLVTVVVTAALDNLLKGAASQAIENLNLMLGVSRTAGLEHLARHA